MTLCVAATAPEAIPRAYRRMLRIEPGIVLVSDTRFTYPSGWPAQDDGLKVAPVVPWAIAGFSGLGQIAEPALGRLADELADATPIKPSDLAVRAGMYLRESWAKFESAYATRRPSPPLDTAVLIGIRDTRTGKFLLYLLEGTGLQSPTERFVPQQRSGALAIGSGASRFRGCFEAEITFVAQRWVEGVRGKPRAAQEVSLQDCVLPVVATLDAIVEGGSDPAVGGKIEAIILTARTAKRIDKLIRIEPKTGQVTPLNLVRLRPPSVVDSSMRSLAVVEAFVSTELTGIDARADRLRGSLRPGDDGAVLAGLNLEFRGYGADLVRLELERPDGSREQLRFPEPSAVLGMVKDPSDRGFQMLTKQYAKKGDSLAQVKSKPIREFRITGFARNNRPKTMQLPFKVDAATPGTYRILVSLNGVLWVVADFLIAP